MLFSLSWVFPSGGVIAREPSHTWGHESWSARIEHRSIAPVVALAAFLLILAELRLAMAVKA